MQIPFVKYQGTGNDFILIDHSQHQYFRLDDHDFVTRLCSRHFGIGADGLMVVEKSGHADHAFTLHYFNADGHLGSLCGNGSRCAVAFAHRLGLFETSGYFMAYDGAHQAWLHGPADVEISLSEPIFKPKVNNDYILNTGSPHLVRFQKELDAGNAYTEGKALRYSSLFAPEGLNVNFVKASADGLEIITYERGVEDLTLSCGTGAVAAALGWAMDTGRFGAVSVPIKARGGWVIVSFQREAESFTHVRLRGPAEWVFSGSIAG